VFPTGSLEGEEEKKDIRGKRGEKGEKKGKKGKGVQSLFVFSMAPHTPEFEKKNGRKGEGGGREICEPNSSVVTTTILDQCRRYGRRREKREREEEKGKEEAHSVASCVANS